MKKRYPKVGSGFDLDYPMGKVTGVPICHICKFKVFGTDVDDCKKYGAAPLRYSSNYDKVDCPGLRIDKQAVWYFFFQERIEKGEIKDGME